LSPLNICLDLHIAKIRSVFHSDRSTADSFIFVKGAKDQSYFCTFECEEDYEHLLNFAKHWHFKIYLSKLWILYQLSANLFEKQIHVVITFIFYWAITCKNNFAIACLLWMNAVCKQVCWIKILKVTMLLKLTTASCCCRLCFYERKKKHTHEETYKVE
jgi:hypothetical protein